MELPLWVIPPEPPLGSRLWPQVVPEQEAPPVAEEVDGAVVVSAAEPLGISAFLSLPPRRK